MLVSSILAVPCSVYVTCDNCTSSSTCIWCSGNETKGHCISGSLFGPSNSSCGVLQWQYKQCTLPGLWVIVLAAVAILIIIIIIALLVWCFCKTKAPNDDSSTRLLIQAQERHTRHTQPLDVFQSNSSPSESESLSASVDPVKGALGHVPQPQTGRTIGDWTEYKDDKGDSYYHNAATDESSWDPPAEFKYEEEYEYTPEQEDYFRNNTGRYLVRTLYPFTSDRPDLWQLSFDEGELIWVVDSHHEEEWWIGEKCDSGQRGYFPKTYVQVLKRKFKVGAAQGEKVQELHRELSKHGL